MKAYLMTSTVKQKKIRGIRIGKEDITLSHFVNDMVVYVENPEESIGKL